MGGQDVAYDRYGSFHRYRFLGDLEVMIAQFADSAIAAARAREEFKVQQANGKAGVSMGNVLQFSVDEEAVAGNDCWTAWILRAEGRCIVRVGFSTGRYYAAILWDADGGKEKVAGTKEKASRAARYIAGKLNRTR